MARGPHEKPYRLTAKKNSATRPVKVEPEKASKLVRKFKDLVRREVWAKDDPDHEVDWSDHRVWEKIRNEGCYHRADEMMVSCGTVTIDRADSPQPMVLLVYNKNIGIYQLPKGRKNFGEEYLHAALRETGEETGVAVEPLQLKFGSRSTPPKLGALVPTQTRESKYGFEDSSTGITEGLSNESIGTSEWCVIRHLSSTILTFMSPLHLVSFISNSATSNPDPATGAWRHIYWFAAKPLGDTKRNESLMTEEEDRNKFSTFWFSYTDAIPLLKLEDEKFMVQIAFAYLRDMAASDWASSRE